MKRLLLAFVVILAGCGPFAEVVKVQEPTAKDSLDRVTVYKREELQGKKFELVQTVTALSCKNKLWDPDPSEKNAIDQLRFKASRIGANAISSVNCTAPSSVNLGTNCWSGITCTASAIAVSN